MEIRLENLNKTYVSQDGGKIRAVKGLSLTIPDGKILCLLGPSGCGKSTLLGIINGLIVPETGIVRFDGEDVSQLGPEMRAVGMVFQNYALYPHMTVRQNIQMPLDNPAKGERPGKEEKKRRVDEIAGLLHVDEFLDRRPDELSGGQQQRVSIARALVRKPDILLLDEPLSNLDRQLRMEIMQEIRKIQRDTGITTLFVTHDQREAMHSADIIAVMNEGEIQQVGTPEEIYERPANLFTAMFFGEPVMNLLHGCLVGGKVFVEGTEIFTAEGLPDQKVVVGFRPENTVLGSEGGLRGRITHLEKEGKDMLAVISFGDTKVSAYLPEDAALPEGTPLSFGIRDGGVLLFSEDSGKALNF